MLTFTASSETVQISVPHHCSMFDSQPRRQNLREVTPVQHTRADDRDRSDQGLPATRIPVGVVVEPAATGVEQDAVVGIDCIVTGVGLEIGRRQRVEDRDGEIDRIAVRSRAGGIEVADRVVGRVDRGIEDEELCSASLAPGREQNANGFICTCKSTTPHLTHPQRQPRGRASGRRERRAAHPPHIKGAGDQHALHQRQPQQHAAELAVVHQHAKNKGRHGLANVQPGIHHAINAAC